MHFLCGIDSSAGARTVAYVAAQLARRAGAELTLAHVAPAPARRELDALADDIAAAFGTRPDVRAVPGDDPAGGLTTTVRAPACDLIVIGASGRGRVAGALRAGTRDTLVDQADCPVVVVPRGAALPSGDGVAVAYDTFAASAGAVSVAAHLASTLGASLTVVHVLPDPRFSTRPVLPMHRDVRAIVESTEEGEALDLRHVFAYRLPAAQLVQTVAQLQPALLAVAAPRRGWRSLFRSPAGVRLLRSASCPVVVVPTGPTGAAVRAAATPVAAPAG